MGKQRKAMGKQSLFFNFLCDTQVIVRYNALWYDALKCLTSMKNDHIHGTSGGHTEGNPHYTFRIASSVCLPARCDQLCS